MSAALSKFLTVYRVSPPLGEGATRTVQLVHQGHGWGTWEFDATEGQALVYEALVGRVGAVRITVEPATAPATPPRPAEEIAREMVTGAGERLDGDWGFTIWARDADGHDLDLSVDGYVREESAGRDSKRLQAGIAALIEQSRAEGAAAERERQRAPIDHTTHGRVTAEDYPNMSYCPCCGGPQQAECAKAGCGYCDAASHPEQPRDLAGRIREALRRLMPDPYVTRDSAGREVWESVVVKPDGRGLRLGLDWTRDESARRRESAIDLLVKDLEAIVRECAGEPKR